MKRYDIICDEYDKLLYYVLPVVNAFHCYAIFKRCVERGIHKAFGKIRGLFVISCINRSEVTIAANCRVASDWYRNACIRSVVKLHGTARKEREGKPVVFLDYSDKFCYMALYGVLYVSFVFRTFLHLVVRKEAGVVGGFQRTCPWFTSSKLII